jgi:hypothetical protein
MFIEYCGTFKVVSRQRIQHEGEKPTTSGKIFLP